MKLNIKGIKKIPIIQLFVIVMCLTLLMGQEGYPSQSLINEVRSLLEAKFPPEQGPFYVTKLSFIDTKVRCRIATTESELLNDAVVDLIVQATKLNSTIKFNAPGHTIKDTWGNVNKLIDLIFDPNLTPTERTMKIINEMMEPAGVDVIVTGQFVDESEKIYVKPIVIVKKNRRVVAKSLTFLKADYICPDPVDPEKKALCPNTYEKSAQMLKELLEQL
jgi:hypothetical protein